MPNVDKVKNPWPIMTKDEFLQLHIGPRLELEQQEVLGVLLCKYKLVFIFSNETGKSKVVQYVIDMVDAPPVYIYISLQDKFGCSKDH